MPELMKTRHSELPINIMFEEFQALEELQKIAQKQGQKRRKIKKLKMEEWISIQKKMRWQQDPSQGASCPGGGTPHGDPTILIFLYRYPLCPWKNHEENNTEIPLLIQPVQDSLQIYFLSILFLYQSYNPEIPALFSLIFHPPKPIGESPKFFLELRQCSYYSSSITL